MKPAGINKMIFLLLIIAVCTILGRAQDRSSLKQTSILATRVTSSNLLMEDYDVKFYGLDIKADNRSDRIGGSATILVEVLKSSFDTLVFDLLHSLKVEKVQVEGAEMNFAHTGDQLYIALPAPVDSGDLISTEIFYGG